MTDASIARLRIEAMAQREKAALLRRRASWWRPFTRLLFLLDAAALEAGADELDRHADAGLENLRNGKTLEGFEC